MKQEFSKLDPKGSPSFYFIWFLFFILMLVLWLKIVGLLYHPDIAKILRQNDLQFFLSSRDFAPEPVERMQFILGVLSSPFFIYLSCLLSKFICQLKSNYSRYLRIVLLSLGLMFIVFWFFLIYQRGVRHLDATFIDTYFVLGHTFKYKLLYLLSALVASWIIGLDVFNKQSKLSKILSFVFLSLAVMGFSLFSIYSFASYHTTLKHLNAMIYSVSQVYRGKDLLVDFYNQYGFYPYFLLPIFKLIGLSVLKFTLIMTTIRVFSLVLILYLLNKLIKNLVVRVLIFLSMVYFAFELNFPDPYFQYHPLRSLFPILAIFLTYLYLKKEKTINLIINSVVFSAAFFWNPDSGIAVFLSLIAILVYLEFLKETPIKVNMTKLMTKIGIAVASLIIVCLIMGSVIFLRSGVWPNFLTLFAYDKIFYISGFYMIKMPSFGLWQVLLSVYVVALLKSLYLFLQKDRSSGLEFFLGILGLGLFTYYQGRSHDMVLAVVSIPAWILIGLFIEELIKYRQNQRFIASFLLYMIMLFLVFAPINMFAGTKQYVSRAKEGLKAFDYFQNSQLEFIRKNSSPSEEVFIISVDDEGMILAETNLTDASESPSSTETLLRSDLQRLARQLENGNGKVFLEQVPPLQDEIGDVLKDKYKEISRSDDGSARLLIRSGL